jgi:hypothetical protein
MLNSVKLHGDAARQEAVCFAPPETLPFLRGTVFLMVLSKPAVFEPFSHGAKFFQTVWKLLCRRRPAAIDARWRILRGLIEKIACRGPTGVQTGHSSAD